MASTTFMTDTFRIGGELEVRRLGFGAMRLTGPGIWGPPGDPDECRAVLRRAPELGINFIDTADSYGPDVAEDLIGETLRNRDDVVIATKAGLTRSGPQAWAPVGRPEYLRQQCLMSLRRLRREVIDLWQLHRIDPKVPREEQFGTLRDLQQEGKVRFVGLSEVSVEEIEAAREIADIVSVQNRYNPGDRGSAEVLRYCEANGIAFIPWAPLAGGSLRSKGPLADIARERDAPVGVVALAWLLADSDCMLPIPGTSKVVHLEENMRAATIQLTEAQVAAIEATVA
jgi:aryl-alcohol dehydrogenase-like predicted oxidoreductase